jgi:hypothetical protein
VTAASSRQRFRQRLLVLFLLLMMVAYVRQVISSPTLAQDFRVFYAAASLVAEGADPYSWPALADRENALYNAPHNLTPADPTHYYYFLAYPEGPWLAFGLAPLSRLPWQLAYAIYAVLIGLAMAAGAYAVFWVLRWRPPLRPIVTACVLLSPIGFINLFMGQVSALVFSAFALAWALARRYPIPAGLLLTLIWLKPNIGLPLPIVAALLEPRQARRLLGSFAVGSAVAFGVATIWLGSAFFEWPLQVPRMWAAVQGPQPDIASIESFYYPGLSGLAKTLSLVVSLIAAVLYAVWAMRRAAGPLQRGLTLLLVWMCALPFVQSYDMILLLPVLAVLLGPELSGWKTRLVELTVWAFMIFPLLYFVGLRIGFFNGFTAIPVTLLAIAWHTRVLTARRGAEEDEAVAA